MKFKFENTEDLLKQIKEHNREAPTKLMICTPAYGGLCGARYMLSLVNTVEMLLDLGFEYRICILSNDSLVPHARNCLAASFLYSDFTHLMFIDADIEWRPQDVLNLWLADRDVCAGIYSKKRINWDLIERAADAGKRPLADFAGEYVFNPVPGDKSGETDEIGMVEVQEAGTGFMMIKRAVLETLQKTVPTYKDSIDGLSTEDHWEFFPIGPVDGRYQSEDYSFCQLWRQAGGKIYINPFLSLTHHGSWAFKGNLARLGQESF